MKALVATEVIGPLQKAHAQSSKTGMIQENMETRMDDESIKESLFELDLSAVDDPNTEPLAYTCSECGHIANNQISLTRHVRTHVDPQFRCNDCNRTFQERYGLHSHGCTAKPKSIMCSECGQTFFSKSGLVNHNARVHRQSECKFECSTCGERFLNKNHLVRHEETHMGYKQYSCICGLKYSTKCNLSRHAKACTGTAKSPQQAQRFLCTECGMTFSRSDQLSDHIKGKHIGIARYRCEKCFKSYKWRASFVRHNLKCQK